MKMFFYKTIFKLARPAVRKYFQMRGNKDPRYSQELEQRFTGEYHDLPKSFLLKCGKAKSVHIHAASLGEVNLVLSFIKQVVAHEAAICKHTRQFQSPIVITTNTPTGRQAALKFINQELNNTICQVVYTPLEYETAIQNFLTSFNPKVSYFVETEIWPLFITLSAQHHPLHLINARMSAKNYVKYSSGLFRQALTSFSSIVAQSEYACYLFYQALHGVPVKELTTSNFSSFQQQCLTAMEQGVSLTSLDSDAQHTHETSLPALFYGKNLKFCKNFVLEQTHLLKCLWQHYSFAQQRIVTTGVVNALVTNQATATTDTPIASPDIAQVTSIDAHNSFNSSLQQDYEFTPDQVANPYHHHLWLLASTYANELAITLPAFAQLSDARLIIAPRHVEQFTPCIELLTQQGYQVTRFSQIKAAFEQIHQELANVLNHPSCMQLNEMLTTMLATAPNTPISNHCATMINQVSLAEYLGADILDQLQSLFVTLQYLCGFDREGNVLVIDTIGDLSSMYAFADYCLVGGTFNRVGGHDVIEAIANQLPVMLGPNFQSQLAIVQQLQGVQGITIVPSDAVATPINNSERIADLGCMLTGFTNTKPTKINFNNSKQQQLLTANLLQLLQQYQQQPLVLQQQAFRAYQYFVTQQTALQDHLHYLGLDEPSHK